MPPLKREIQEMPQSIADRLFATGLHAAYDARPPYQRNDYLAWIARAMRDETREKRTTQMLDELKAADTYMKMRWNGGKK